MVNSSDEYLHAIPIEVVPLEVTVDGSDEKVEADGELLEEVATWPLFGVELSELCELPIPETAVAKDFSAAPPLCDTALRIASFFPLSLTHMHTDARTFYPFPSSIDLLSVRGFSPHKHTHTKPSTLYSPVFLPFPCAL